PRNESRRAAPASSAPTSRATLDKLRHAMHVGDTICAISTPPGRGGIGVVRISGPDSIKLASDIFRSISGDEIGEPNRARFGSLGAPHSLERIDQAVAPVFRGPRFYPGEDVVELSCHGSPAVLAKVLRLLTDSGA